MTERSLPRIPSIPRVRGLPDPLRRIHVQKKLGYVSTRSEEADPASAGMTEESVERIWSSVRTLYRAGVHPAIQVCVRREGKVVIDRAIGHATGNGPADSRDADKRLATPETPFLIYSGSKAITAFATHLCRQQGLLDLGDPVAKHIPGYERHGKEDITVGHVLAHRAGVPNLPPSALDLDLIGDREFLVETLCDAKPFREPGKALAYHAVSGGFILGEVINRVTGRDIRRFVADEILDPLGFRWTNYGVAPEDVPLVATNYVTGPRTLPPISTMLTRALGTPLDDLVAKTNDPRFLTGIVPAASTVTTANELSRFFELMRRGGELDGVRIFDPETINGALVEQSHLELDLSLGFPTRFSYGLMLGAQMVSLYGRDTQRAFGHLGFTNILGWADPARATSVAVITSGKPIIYPELINFYDLCQRITSETPKA